MKAPKLRRMVIEPSENGGVVVHHDYPPKLSKSGAYIGHEEHKPYTFGPSQHQEFHDHIDKHLAFTGAQDEEMEDEGEGR